jgi:peptidoglycan LD-endopeptidase CwlK
MSAPLFPDDVLFLQRLLRADGLYHSDFNGRWDGKTEKAFAKFEVESRKIQHAVGTFDMRSEQAIGTLALRAQRASRLSLRRLLDNDINTRIISGTRTYAEQNALYKQGRFGDSGNIVTKAQGGSSNHNFGIAWDIGIFTSSGGYLTDTAEYQRAASFAMADDIEWDGSWVGFVDPPHYQLKLSVSLAQLRTQFEAGSNVSMIA